MFCHYMMCQHANIHIPVKPVTHAHLFSHRRYKSDRKQQLFVRINIWMNLIIPPQNQEIVYFKDDLISIETRNKSVMDSARNDKVVTA